jgi:hypothetical protein
MTAERRRFPPSDFILLGKRRSSWSSSDVTSQISTRRIHLSWTAFRIGRVDRGTSWRASPPPTMRAGMARLALLDRSARLQFPE